MGNHTVDDPITTDSPKKSGLSPHRGIGGFFKDYSLALSVIGGFILMLLMVGYYGGELKTDVNYLGEEIKSVKLELSEDIKEVKAEVKDLARDVNYIRGRLDERGITKPPESTKLSDSN